ncbi:hypothetical protein [Pseudoxanthomonas kaohsiungensis]|uniref:Uncharacterized protein n=1 Tax=Pseudoxanthomonas kaohsiungensis TaxID=283923 RepID=A0ABW3M2C9_9GAMM|nr:hypothetical protein [Pseudoxanthomonas kaohsiungensis]KAF1702903.1 hypothetical protein CSC66_09010 [Pseudoxanthomonas kaohsiungensis]
MPTPNVPIPTSRIPDCDTSTVEGMRAWFDAMHARGLMFHPEDSPEQLVTGVDGRPAFTKAECEQLGPIMRELFDKHGDAVCYQALAAIGGVDGDEDEECQPKP